MFGTGGYPSDSKTCGNEAKHVGDNSDKIVNAMGYILNQGHSQVNCYLLIVLDFSQFITQKKQQRIRKIKFLFAIQFT